ncbi:MAG: DJ-1/PfpI family protein [Candidatus Micrarchaeaceae archaeon]
MKYLLFVPPKNFRDESLKTVRLLFDRWKIGYSISSYTKSGVGTGAHGATAKIDINTNKANPEEYDGIILLDGSGIEEYKIYDFRPLLDLVNLFIRLNKRVVSIGNSAKILAKANVIKGLSISAPKDPSVRNMIEMFHGSPSDKGMEISGNIITMNGSELEYSIQKFLEHIGVK